MELDVDFAVGLDTDLGRIAEDLLVCIREGFPVIDADDDGAFGHGVLGHGHVLVDFGEFHQHGGEERVLLGIRITSYNVCYTKLLRCGMRESK